MAITEKQFLQAFREAACIEFQCIPPNDSDIVHQFSKDFEIKMQKMIKHQKSTLWNLVNTTAKRVAVIAILIIILALGACSIPAVREAAVKFFIEISEISFDYSFKGPVTYYLAHEYYIPELPAGFAETNSFTEGGVMKKTYKNANGDTIIFSQSITAYTVGGVDAEMGDTKTVYIAGKEVYLYFSDTYDTRWRAMWIDNGYLLKLFVIGNFNEEQVHSLIEQITYE